MNLSLNPEADLDSALAAHSVNNYKGSIYMVFDYMHHDLTGLMQRRQNKFTVAEVSTALV